MELTVKESSLDDWWVIERAEHNGASGLKPTSYGFSFWHAARFSDADVEGSSEEMHSIAEAIEKRGSVSHKRCAVEVEGTVVKFRSPRNSMTDGECSLAEADALATQIRERVPR